MNCKSFVRLVMSITMIGAITSFPASPAYAGRFRLFRGRQAQNCYVQPAAPATAGTPQQYQSFSYEPGTTAPQAAPPAASQSVNSGVSSYRGGHRVEPGHSVPNMFRADRKVLGLSGN